MLAELIQELRRGFQREGAVNQLDNECGTKRVITNGLMTHEWRDTDDVPRCVSFERLHSLVESTRYWDATELYVNGSNVVAVYPHVDGSPGYPFGYYPLVETAGWIALSHGRRELKPADAVLLMRTDWRQNISSEVRSLFQNVTFAVEGTEGHQTAHTGDTLGRSVHGRTATGGEGLPEEISWTGPRWIDENHIYAVTIVVTARPEKGTIVFDPVVDTVNEVEKIHSVQNLANEVKSLQEEAASTAQLFLGHAPAITREQYVDRYKDALFNDL